MVGVNARTIKARLHRVPALDGRVISEDRAPALLARRFSGADRGRPTVKLEVPALPIAGRRSCLVHQRRDHGGRAKGLLPFARFDGRGESARQRDRAPDRRLRSKGVGLPAVNRAGPRLRLSCGGRAAGRRAILRASPQAGPDSGWRAESISRPARTARTPAHASKTSIHPGRMYGRVRSLRHG